MPDIQKYRELLTDLSLRSNQDYTRSESAKCLAGILNKAPDGMLIFFFTNFVSNNFKAHVLLIWMVHAYFLIFFQIYYLEFLLNLKTIVKSLFLCDAILHLIDEEMAVYLQQRRDFYVQTLTSTSTDTSCLQQCVWVTKALVMRGHKEANKFVNIVSIL